MKTKIVNENAIYTFFRPQRKRDLYTGLILLGKNTFYKLRISLDKPKRDMKRTHHISICLIFKDEAPYLKEWIEYHRMIGVDHFYLYDNNSSDGFESVIKSYLEMGIVTLIRWTKNHAQVEAYEDCIRNFQKESDWIGFIDIDEFLVPIAEKSLVTFLDRFSHRPAVLVYWRFFGSNGLLTRDMSRLVIEEFTVASEKLYTKGKCFFNSNYDYLWNSSKNKSMFHFLWTDSKGLAVPPVDVFDRVTYGDFYWASGFFDAGKKIPIQLNHYAVKSFMEHRQKDIKGDVYYDHPTHGDKTFFSREKRCSVPDYHIYKYVTELKFRLNEVSKGTEKNDRT